MTENVEDRHDANPSWHHLDDALKPGGVMLSEHNAEHKQQQNVQLIAGRSSAEHIPERQSFLILPRCYAS